MNLRIVTWNINSVRLRMPLLLRLIDEQQPDIICLQETKVVDDSFPAGPLTTRGYAHQHISGMKSYNGVAVLSKIKLDAHAVQHWCGRQDCRHIAATIAEGAGRGIEVHCLYIPAGGDIPDPALNDKFAHKLQFIDELTAWWPAARAADQPMILLGDLNIAPLEHDVWSHRQLLDVVSHTPVEVAKLAAMQSSLGWVDALRHFVPDTEKLYTWWSYRAADWQVGNRGRRLDHIWVTPPLAKHLTTMQVLREARNWPQPSDHVPVILDIAL